jgi:hypothetical protein
MGFLELVNTTETKRFEHESGDWIEVKANVSKREVNAIAKRLPTSAYAENEDGSWTAEVAVGTAEALFGALVVGWSLPVPATVENYLALKGEPAAWIDQQLFQHFFNVQLTGDEAKKPSTSPRGQRKDTGKTE